MFKIGTLKEVCFDKIEKTHFFIRKKWVLKSMVWVVII